MFQSRLNFRRRKLMKHSGRRRNLAPFPLYAPVARSLMPKKIPSHYESNDRLLFISGTRDTSLTEGIRRGDRGLHLTAEKAARRPVVINLRSISPMKLKDWEESCWPEQ
jgi:hypothetical protein